MSTKDEFIELLRSTNREGVEDLLEGLEKIGFFTAPASATHHLNIEGGLVQHSLNTLVILPNLHGVDELDEGREILLLYRSLIVDIPNQRAIQQGLCL